jgi:phage-related protein
MLETWCRPRAPWYGSRAYRAVYVVNLGERVYVLHTFQKKSKTGLKTPQPEIRLVRARLRRAVELAHQRR